MQYTIYDAPEEYSQDGVVWIKQPGIRQNSIVKIKLRASGKCINCQARQMDYNFLKNFERQHPVGTKIDHPEQSIVMNMWYRSCLNNLKVQNQYDIEVASSNFFWDKINACRQHPQLSIRSTTWLGITSVALGATGLFLGIISLL